MGKNRYLLKFKNERQYDSVIQAAESDGVSIAHWLREAVSERLQRRLKANLDAELKEAYIANNRR